MLKKKLTKYLWFGSDVDSKDNPITPQPAPEGEPLDGLNEGELYIHNNSKNPTLYTLSSDGKVVPIGGNTDVLDKRYLRKDKDDRSKGKIASDKGFEVGNYINGMIGGQGGRYYKDENGKVVLVADKIHSREELLAPKITYNCIEVVSGEQASSFAYGNILSVDKEAKTASLNLLGDEYGTLHEKDLCRGIFHFLENTNNTDYELDHNKFHNYSGFTTSYFKVIEILENSVGKMTFRYELQEGTSVHPCPSMNFYAFGNTDDVDRQSITYRTREYERRLVKMNDWEIKPSVNIAMQNGKLDGLTIGGVELKGYGTYQDNCYFTGTTFQLSKEQKEELKGNTIFKSTAFRRYNGIPPKPKGGTFENPIPEDADDNGIELWSDGIPSGEEILWASTRLFSSDESENENTQWSEPSQMTDTSSFDVEYSNLESPTAPTGHPNTNPDWSNVADENTIWMATSTKENGVWSDWNVIKIKGEKGEPGKNGEDGKNGDNGENAQYYTVEAAVATIGFTMTGSYSPSSFVVSEYSINGSLKTASNVNYLHIYGIGGGNRTYLASVSNVKNYTFNAAPYQSNDYDGFLFELTKTIAQTSTFIASTTVSVARRGVDGTGIKSVTVTYGKSSSADTKPTSWSPTIPALSDGEFLWTKTTTDYTDSSIQDTDSFTLSKQGKNGVSVTVKETKYQAGESATQPPSGEWKALSQVTVPQGQYLWTKIVFSDNSTIFNVAKQGENGKDGEDGVTIVSIEYKEGTSPTNPPTGTWSQDVVEVAQGNYLWTKTTYSDGSEAYGVARQGMDSTVAGPAGAMARYRGEFIENNKSEPYVWDDTYRDIVIYKGNAYQVAARGLSVTDAPTAGVSNSKWEMANKFRFVAMDTALIDSANIGGFMFKRSKFINGIPVGRLESQYGPVVVTDIAVNSSRTAQAAMSVSCNDTSYTKYATIVKMKSGVAYSLQPSLRYIRKDKNNVSENTYISCSISSVSTIPDGYTLKYSRDSGSEISYTLGYNISTSSIQNSITFSMYDSSNQIVERQTVYVLKEGSSIVTLVYDEYIQVACNEDNSIKSGLPIRFNIVAYKGWNEVPITSMSVSGSGLTVDNDRIELDAETGTFKCSNVNLSGVINATGGIFKNIDVVSGTIGGLTISENSITSAAGTKGMTITGQSILFEFSGTEFVRINSSSDDALFYGRMDNGKLMKLAAYGSNATALDVLCNGSGVGRAINSVGENFFISRYSSTVTSGEQTMIAGLSLSCKNGTSFTTPSNISNIPTAWVDFLVATGNITLPPANNYPGKIIFVKFQGNYKVSSSSNIVDPASTSTTTEKTRESKAVFYISNGANWYEFYCG